MMSCNYMYCNRNVFEHSFSKCVIFDDVYFIGEISENHGGLSNGSDG